MVYLFGTIGVLMLLALLALVPFFGILYLGDLLSQTSFGGTAGRFLLMSVKNLRRNLLRTSLTYLAVFVLVVVVTMVWSVLFYLDDLMTEQSKDIKVVVSEKWQAPSHMPFTYAARLAEGAADPNKPGEARPLDSMTWQFYAGTLDALKKTRENSVVMIALEPPKIVGMMYELMDEISPSREQHKATAEEVAQLKEAVRKMQDNKRAIILGHNRIATMNKRLGDRFKLTGLSHRDIDLEFEIVGVLPPGGRYNESAFMNRDYLNDELDAYVRTHGARHPMADKSLDIVWLKVADADAYGHIVQQIETSGQFHNPAVKCETLSSMIGAVLTVYKDILWAMRWLFTPALLVTMALVLSTAISLSVRERRVEIGVMKVLGFRPAQILTMVLGEAVFLGALGGLVSAAATYVVVNHVMMTHNPVPVSITGNALWWGPAIGGLMALIGAVLPAWSACRVNVSEVFARVT